MINTRHKKLSNYQPAVQVVGFGAAGLGVALAADKLGYLSTMLNKGLVYIDKRSATVWTSLLYDIKSNSKASDFLEGIRKDGDFNEILHSSQAVDLLLNRKETIPLKKVASLFYELSNLVINKVSTYEASNFIADTPISVLQIGHDNQVTSFDDKGNPLVSSRFAVASIGGYEKKLTNMKKMADNTNSRYVLSEQVLRNKLDFDLTNLIKNDKKIIVIGGGHSAFSIVEYLLRHYDKKISRHQITVLTRNQINVYYDCIEDYLCSPRLCVDPKLDAETNEVNRYNGVRGDAKHVYSKIMSGAETRVKIEELPACSDSYEKDIGIFIQATGYAAKKIDIVDSLGNTINMVTHKNNYALSKNHNFVSTTGTEYKNIFGLGLGCFSSDTEHFKKTGEIPVGVNIYHAQDAIHIVKNLFTLLNSEIAA